MESTITSTSSDTLKSKLGLCDVCAYKLAKYNCPRCEIKTCSLDCCKIHKESLKCNGERKRTKFITKNNFTNLDLSSDYRFLEEVIRDHQQAKKTSRPLRHNFLNKNLRNLQRESQKRKTILKFLPRTFVRHKNNSSQFNYSLKIIEWRIEWIFVNGNNFKISEERVPETAKVCTILYKHLHEQDKEVIQEELQFYQAVGISGIKLLLQAEQKSGRKFYEIDPTCTLRECLENKVITEFPVIYVILKDQAACYDIIDSDDEDDQKQSQEDVKRGDLVIKKIVMKEEKDNSRNNSHKSFFFGSDCSGEED